MTYSITDRCIECDRCLSVCPTGAIQKTEQRYQIDPTLCNNCTSHYTIAQCWSVCPTSYGCIPSGTTVLTDSQDYWEKWFATYNRMISRLHQAKHSEYWDCWFDSYAQRISRLLQSEHQAIGTDA